MKSEGHCKSVDARAGSDGEARILVVSELLSFLLRRSEIPSTMFEKDNKSIDKL